MLAGLFRGGAADEVRSIDAWGDWGGAAGPTWSGVPVTSESALQLLAVYGCVTFITDEISTLPLDDMESMPGWVSAPSEGLDRIAWTGQIVWSLVMSGNCYLAVRSLRGEVLSMDPIDPAVVTVRREGGRKVFLVNGVPAPFEILHIPGRMRPGSLVGVNPIEYARQSIGLGLAATRYGSEFFNGDGNMTGIIEIPGAAQPETKRDLALQWQKKRRTGGKGLPGVLDQGATWKATGVTNEQAQFLATRKFTAAEIAGQMFLVDPSDLGIPVEGKSLTYANLGQRNTRRVQVTLMPWIRRIESALSPYIPEGSYHFNVDARLRGDTKESYETLAIALVNGFMSIDEVRHVLGLPPRSNVGDAPTQRELAEMVQKLYLGVDIVITDEEARDILRKAGADLPAGPLPGGKPDAAA